MNRLPSNLVGRKVFVILVAGGDLEGECVGARYENDGWGHIVLRIGSWEWTIEADAIAAISVNREGKA